MTDIIKGRVIKVIDNKTFDMDITHHGRENRAFYNETARVRINSIRSDDDNLIEENFDKMPLSNIIHHKDVHCSVRIKGNHNKIIADVKIL